MSQERRQFFRIKPQVALEYQSVTEQDVRTSQQPYQFDVSPYFLLLTELHELEADSSHVMRKLSEKDPNLAAYLQLLNAKIDAVAKAVSAKGMDEVRQMSMQTTDLSEGGMSFIGAQPLDIGQFVAMKIVLPDACIGLLVYAQVQRCEKLDNGGYDLGVAFHKLPENCRTLLARYVIESQARERQRLNDEFDIS